MRIRGIGARLAAATLAVVLVAACSSASGSPTTRAGSRPNIVFVLTDDLDLTSFLNPARFPVFNELMTQAGMNFTNYFVPDSLCCPSRASALRGQYVHNTGVKSNLPPNGGFQQWQKLGRDTSTVATWLHDAGYRTALFGKYLNGYPDGVSPNYIPPGWDNFVSPNGGNPYAEYNYSLNDNGNTVQYGAQPDDYLVDVLTNKSRDYISHTSANQPFFMYIAPYVPHQPATPAPRYDNAFPNAIVPRTPSFNHANGPFQPAWLRRQLPLNAAQIAGSDALYRHRLDSMLAVQDMISTIVDELRTKNELDNTYIVFSSDNGFHLGQHRLPAGKQTAYEEDIHVPLVVRGPGIEPGSTEDGFAREVDLAPTFAALAGAPTPDWVDGTSLVPYLRGVAIASGMPHDALIEHYGVPLDQSGARAAALEPDNDANPPIAGAPKTGLAAPVQPTSAQPIIPTYAALRTARYLYVVYSTGEKQLFDLHFDPYELHNVVTVTDPAIVRALAQRLTYLRHCAGATCRD